MLYSTCNLEAPIMGSKGLFVFRRMERGHSGDHPVVWVLTHGYQSPFRVRDCPLGPFSAVVMLGLSAVCTGVTTLP